MNNLETNRALRKYYSSPVGVRPQIGILVFPGFDPEQFRGPFACFRLAGEADSLYPLILSLEGGEVAGATGETVMTRPVTADGLDTLLIIGGLSAQTIPRLPELADFVCAASGVLRRIAGIGTGVLILAEAGLLNGRRAATGAQYSAQLARAYPAIRVNRGRTFINDGGLWSAPDAASGVEMCLTLIEQEYGSALCHAIASHLPDMLGKSRGLSREQHLSPAETERAERARRHVQNGRDSFAAIARAAGFKDAEDMRRRFLRYFGQPPQVLRRAARLAQRAHNRGNIIWPAVTEV